MAVGSNVNANSAPTGRWALLNALVLVFLAFLSLCYLIETLVRFSVHREGERMVVTTHGVFRSSSTGGAAFQRAPTTEPTTDGYGMP
ncbi:unnamed protein product [Hymenolepis diminuta]|uniref:Movement protein n=1 Tax=Hymenolepis diminuta TaxID=6216 RepID=A0A0R3SI18_HYMDI|nr:unnamed protein product [Hymenolepis diminuta]